LRVNLDTGEVTYNGKPLHLTPKEQGLSEQFELFDRAIAKPFDPLQLAQQIAALLGWESKT
jgi:DNA-binding response OmpR family regulator